jgi:hypothetical protein
MRGLGIRGTLVNIVTLENGHIIQYHNVQFGNLFTLNCIKMAAFSFICNMGNRNSKVGGLRQPCCFGKKFPGDKVVSDERAS